MNAVNVLVTAASRRVALVRHLRRALEATAGRLVAVDCTLHSPALYFAHRHHQVPMAGDPGYLEAVLRVAEQEGIGLVVPTFDGELLLWARAREELERRGILVSISPPETVEACVDKWETGKLFRLHGLPYPETWLPGAVPESATFPLFVKPRAGRGSEHACAAHDRGELERLLEIVPDAIVQDCLSGQEFTVDAFCDRNGSLIGFVPRYRLAVRAGVSDRGQTFRDAALAAWIESLCRVVPFRGAINIQGKIGPAGVSFFEVNPRFSGGIQLTLAAGADFMDWLVREARGEPLAPRLGAYEDGVVMISFEESLFLRPGTGGE